MIGMAPLEARGNRPLQMTFEDQLKALVFFHLQEHKSARHLLQVLEEDDFARNKIAPEQGIKKSSFSEATNSRGLEQFMYVFKNLQTKATRALPNHHPDLGNLVGIDGSLIDATLSMCWADYRKGAKKAKVHVGFDLNHSIPRKIFLTDGNGAERPFVSQILSPGDTGVMDRGYQCHKRFDLWQQENTLFMCRIKASTRKTIIKANHVKPDSIVFYDAVVLLGTAGVNQTEKPLRLVGYEVDNVKYWIATNRHVRLCTRMGLHIGVGSVKKPGRPRNSQFLYGVRICTSPIVTAARISLGILVGQDTGLGGHHGRAYQVF
jgi:hypothetical protein